ncbi:NUDIX domain-containing protein [Prevotella sp. HUN102]|uniref:NUDIX hydrolase n=1 Tax=Prevotella sp. HUN102 TaxID=1392486 RepID=UPI000490CE86|nr:NUDIX domain-containing protein [Prevotella sp. HUN102]
MNKFYQGAEKLLVSVDCIIFGFQDNKLKLLIGKRKGEPGVGEWSLYGGFVRADENLKDAANRVLYECTGIDNIYMQQVGAFGKIDRDPGDRVISVAYCALINVGDYDASLMDRYGLMWAELDRLPPLYGDHIEMVQKALNQLREQISVKPLSFKLLPDLFTLTQLQHVHEAVLGEDIDKRNFRKRIKQIDYIEKTELIDKLTSKRGAALYRFNLKAYREAPKFNLK